MKDIFTIKRYRDYISLYLMGVFVGNYDSDREITEAKKEILGY